MIQIDRRHLLATAKKADDLELAPTDRAAAPVAGQAEDRFEPAPSFDASSLLRPPFLAARAVESQAARGAGKALEGLDRAALDLVAIDPQEGLVGGSPLDGSPFDDISELWGRRETGGEGSAHPDTARFPELPSNRRGRTGAASDALRPSGDLRGVMAGAASGKELAGDKTVETDPRTGDRTTTYSREDGTSTIVRERSITSGRPLDDGRVLISETLRSVEERAADGSGTTVHYRRDPDTGSWEETNRTYRLPPQGGIDRTQDPNAAGSTVFLPPNYVFRDTGPRDPDRMNPGPDGAIPDPLAVRLAIDPEDLASDPDASRASRALRSYDGPRFAIPLRVLPPRPGSGGDGAG